MDRLRKLTFSSRKALAVACSTASLLLALMLAPPAFAAGTPKSADAPKGDVQKGRKLFVQDGCYECHGREAQGSLLLGPRLGPDPLPLEAIMGYVRKPTGEMPPYTDKVISDQELADIHAFLESLPQPPRANSIPILK